MKNKKNHYWKNDFCLAKIIQSVKIENQDVILREVICNYGYSDTLQLYAEAISEKRLSAAKKSGIISYLYEELYVPSKVTFQGRDHIVRVSSCKLCESMNRSGFDKIILEILQQINGSSDLGVLQFLPFLANPASALDYFRKEIPAIAFVDLKYNPKQIAQRAYLISQNR